MRTIFWTIFFILSPSFCPHPLTEWHKQLGENILADGVLNRLFSKAYKIIISGDSRRKK